MRHLPNEVLISHAKACMEAIRDHAVAMNMPGTPVHEVQDHLKSIRLALGGVLLGDRQDT